MGGDSSYLAILRVAGFLAAAWGATKLSRIAGVSSIVAEIAVGAALGPRIVGLMPSEYAECEHRVYMDCMEPEDFNGGFGMLGYLEHFTDVCHKEDYEHHNDSIGFSFEVKGISYAKLMADAGMTLNITDAISDVVAGRAACSTESVHVSWSAAEPTARRLSGQEAPPLASVDVHEEPDRALADIESSLGAAIVSEELQRELNDVIRQLPRIDSVLARGFYANAVAVFGLEADWLTTTTMTTVAPSQSKESQDIPPPTASEEPTDAPVIESTTTMTETASASDTATGDARRLEECEALLESSGRATGAPLRRDAEARPAGDLGRRLAGGGGGHSYDSFGECLVKECEHEQNKLCQLYPDIFTLIGQTGVAMMIFESGMHFDFGMAAQVGPCACVVAVIGTVLPLVAGTAVMYAFNKPIMPDGIAAGTALAPTSVGISLRLLSEAKVLHLPFGQTIMTAAFVDDILSLILFNILFSLGDGEGEITFMGTFFWSVMGVAFMIVATVLAVIFWPCFINNVLLPGAGRIMKWSSDEPDPKVAYKDQALFVIMLALLIGYGTITYICGTHLWGCFIAGMSFACLKPAGHAHHVWVNQTKRMTSWMIRIFFACTVAFSIPVDSLISLEAFWKGAIMGVGPCILTKVCCALFMGPPRFVIGWAMVGRAEFAYLIAQMAAASGMLDPDTFSIVIWSLLWATVFAPLVFRCVLNRYVRNNNILTGDGAHHATDEDRLRLKEPAPEPALVEELRQRNRDLEERCRELEAKKEEFRLEAHAQLEQTLAYERAAPKVAVEATPAPWEEAAVAPQESAEKDVVPLTNNGKGVLCCLFFNKVTMVKPPGGPGNTAV